MVWVVGDVCVLFWIDLCDEEVEVHILREGRGVFGLCVLCGKRDEKAVIAGCMYL